MGSSRSGLLPKKPKELLPLPPRQRLQQRPDQSLDLYLTVFLASRLAHSRHYVRIRRIDRDTRRPAPCS